MPEKEKRDQLENELQRLCRCMEQVIALKEFELEQRFSLERVCSKELVKQNKGAKK